MSQRRTLALEATKKALKARQSLGYARNDPVCVYDAAEKLEVEIRFVNIGSSFEGMYVSGQPPHIIISSLRPSARQAFTCAHELGHHLFKHGTQTDYEGVISASPTERCLSSSQEEYVANQFAASFLMPKSVVNYAFSCRGWTPQRCTPRQAFVVAGWLGVGYRSLINQMHYTLKLLCYDRMEYLLRASPKGIRTQVMGEPLTNPLTIVDTAWIERAIDIQVGGVLLLPHGTLCHGTKRLHHLHTNKQGVFYRAVTQGYEQLYDPNTGWASFVRISRQSYQGRAIYRHLEESDDE